MICPKCGSEMADGSAFCTKCGTSLTENAGQGEPQMNNGIPQGEPQMNNGMPQGEPQMNNGMPQGNPQMNNGVPQGNPQMNNGMPYGNPQPVYIDHKDHTREYDPADVSKNKLLAMLPYIMDVVGIIIALLAAKESPYVQFHIHEGLKISILSWIVLILTVVLCWTLIVPVAGVVCLVILFVVRIISFVGICQGKAKEAAIVSSFRFLR